MGYARYGPAGATVDVLQHRGGQEQEQVRPAGPQAAATFKGPSSRQLPSGQQDLSLESQVISRRSKSGGRRNRVLTVVGIGCAAGAFVMRVQSCGHVSLAVAS